MYKLIYASPFYFPSELLGFSSNQQFQTEIGNVNPLLNDTYNDLSKFLQYCVDNGYLPDVNAVPLIPVMTSNTSSICEITASGYDGIHYPYCAFNNESNYWYDWGHTSNPYICCKLLTPATVRKIHVGFTNWTNDPHHFLLSLQGSNDNANYQTLYTEQINFATSTGTIKREINFNCNCNYTYYRVLTTNQMSGSTSSAPIYKFQLYGKFNN